MPGPAHVAEEARPQDRRGQRVRQDAEAQLGDVVGEGAGVRGVDADVGDGEAGQEGLG